MALRELLEDHDYQVLEAGDGVEALTLFHEHQEDVGLVLTDVTLPGRSGLDLAQEIRELSSDIAVIYASGLGPDDNPPLKVALSEHNTDFIAKPLELDAVMKKVEVMLTVSTE